MAQRFTGVTESVDEFQRRIEKESKQQQSINKALFDLKKQQDQEQIRIKRGLSVKDIENEHKLLYQQQQFTHNQQMQYLNDQFISPIFKI